MFRSSMIASPRCLALAVSSVFALAAMPTQAAYLLVNETGPVAISFRGQANTTYFGWENGTWDGNPDSEPGPTPEDPPVIIPDIINSTPSINPGGLVTAQLVQNNVSDIVSGSNNIYGGRAAMNLTLIVPVETSAPGTGSTTIIIQGNGLGGGAFGGGGIMDSWEFGAAGGVLPTSVYTQYGVGNAEGETQFFIKYELTGSQASYSIPVTATTWGAGVVSITELTVDTFWSPNVNTFAPDSAIAVPEPAAFALGFIGVALMLRRRRG